MYYTSSGTNAIYMVGPSGGVGTIISGSPVTGTPDGIALDAVSCNKVHGGAGVSLFLNDHLLTYQSNLLCFSLFLICSQNLNLYVASYTNSMIYQMNMVTGNFTALYYGREKWKGGREGEEICRRQCARCESDRAAQILRLTFYD